jgi:hypothetical protein
MKTSEKIGQFERDVYPDSTSGAWFHMNYANLGIGIIQVAVCHATEDFSSWLVLACVVKYINPLQRNVR